MRKRGTGMGQRGAGFAGPLLASPWGEGGRRPTQGGAHFAVGITNSAPLGVLSGQRCMMDFCFV